MKARTTATWAGGLTLLLCAAPLAARAVPMVLAGQLNFPAVDCKVDGVAARCLIDTGSQGAVSLPATSAYAGLPVLANRRSMSAGGVAAVSQLVQVGALQVGDFELKPPAEAYRQRLPDPNPVLGSGFFEAMGAVTFDFKAMTLTRDPPSSAMCPGGAKITSMIEVPADFLGQTIHAGWDTGAGFTVVDAGLVARHPDEFHYLKDFPARDAIGAVVRSRIYTTSAITLCGMKIDNLPVAALDLSEARKKKPDLPDVILGDNLLAGHVWAFDFRDGRWSIG